MGTIAVGILVGLLPIAAWAEGATVRFVKFDTVVTPISANRITRALDDAEQAGNDFVLIQLDTPGGLLATTGTLVKRMLNAEVPVVVWVGPAGAHAASAGFFLLTAADVAAMAPGTRTGAASTVIQGSENREDDVLLKKANEDGAALLRSIAARRGRNQEACERAVFAAKAFEETVALDEGIIDLIALDRDDLMRQLHDREVTLFDGSTVVLKTEGATFVESKFNFRDQVLELLGSPAVAAMLLLLGLMGLYIEFTNPGGIFPGVVGAICLVLFALTTQVLPVSMVGVLLLLLAIVLFVLEVKITSYGLLSLGATVCLVIGGMILIDGPIPELRVPPAVIIPVSLAVAALCVLAMTLALRAQSAAVATGVEGLATESGVVTETLDPEGRVRVHGEIWNARSNGGPIANGRQVRIVRVDEMLLTVEALDPDDATGQAQGTTPSVLPSNAPTEG